MAAGTKVRSVPLAELAGELERHYTARGVRPNLHSGMRRVFRILAELGVRNTSGLNARTVKRFEAALPAVGIRYRAQLLGMLRTICNHAVRLEFLAKAPDFPHIPHPWEMPEVERDPAPSKGDVRRLLAYLKSRSADWEGHRLYALVAVIVLAGLRRNEALQLHVAAVDLDGGILRIWRRELKPTSAAPTVVRISPQLAPVLSGWMGRCGSQWLFPGIRRAGPWGRGPGGKTPLDHLKEAAEAAGIEHRPLTFDCLWHFHHKEAVPGVHFDTPSEGTRSISTTSADATKLAVDLGDGPDAPRVWGRLKPSLTPSEARLVLALVRAGSKGLTSGELAEEIDGKKGAVTTLGRLKTKDQDWDRAIVFPGGPYGRYRVASGETS